MADHWLETVVVPGNLHSDPDRRALHFACYKQKLNTCCYSDFALIRPHKTGPLSTAYMGRCSEIQFDKEVSRVVLVTVLAFWNEDQHFQCMEENSRISGRYEVQIFELTFAC